MDAVGDGADGGSTVAVGTQGGVRVGACPNQTDKFWEL